ncbi:Leucine-rich repeat serine threonine- kinase 1, partial [Brachionus plicatilis]
MDGFNINQVAEFGNYDQFKLMADLDINLIDSIEDQYGRTPLIICSKYKNSISHSKIAEYLLEVGCDVNIKADSKWESWTALCTACFYGNSQMVKLILSSKSNLDIDDDQIQKACQIGIDRSNTECVNLILNELENRQIYDFKKNIEINLQKAVYTNDMELLNKTVNEIKENNLNVKQFMNSTTIISHTLLDRACRNSNPELVKILIDLNIMAKPNYYTKYSPLYIVSHMGHYEIAELLIR